MITPSATGRRCKREALPGQERCEVHAEGPPSNDPYYMPKFYRGALRTALAERVAGVLENGQGTQMLDVSEELALVRVAADEVVDLYGQALETEDKGLAQSAAIAVMSAMSDVMKMTETAAKVAAMRQALSGPIASALEEVIQQVTLCAYRAFGDDYRARDFERMLREEILDNIRQVGPAGTNLLPCDDAVLAMDASIPAEPEAEEVAV